MVATPVLAVATLTVGLRLGASGAVRAASVFAAPPGRSPAPGQPAPVALQVLTYVDDRTVRESVPVKGLSVRLRGRDHEARWVGESNADGIAEATLALPEATLHEELELDVRIEGEVEALAQGRVSFRGAAWPPSSDSAVEASPVRPSYRSGVLAVDVLVEGGRIPVGARTSAWLRIGGSSPKAHLELSASPDLGLRLASPRPEVRCEGWAELEVVAEAHVVGLRIDARDADGRTGAWYGALPVAPGAFSVTVPRVVSEGEGVKAEILAPNPRQVAYVEIDDAQGRVFASALTLAQRNDLPWPSAVLSIPPLSPGLHWLVVAGEPRGAERMAGASIGRPFWVGPPPGAALAELCGLGPWLSQQPTPEFPKRLLVDGFTTRGTEAQRRRRLGLALGFGALFVGAALEALLLLGLARFSRARMERETMDLDASERHLVTQGAPGGSVGVAVLLAVLGFGLLAALLLAKA
jgi:hypothetical protein